MLRIKLQNPVDDDFQRWCCLSHPLHPFATDQSHSACAEWLNSLLLQAHIHYLHSDSFGNQDAPQIRDMTSTTDAYGVTASFKLHNKPVRGWEWSSVSALGLCAAEFISFKLWPARRDSLHCKRSQVMQPQHASCNALLLVCRLFITKHTQLHRFLLA